MSLCSEHLEKQEGCPRCEAKLPEVFDSPFEGKTLEVVTIEEPGPDDWKKKPTCHICVIVEAHRQFMGRWLCDDCYDIMREELFNLLEARVGERKGP